MFLVVLGAPAAGLLAAGLVKGIARQRRRPAAAAAPPASLVTAVAVAASLAGVLTVAYGYPRRLAGTFSVFTLSDVEERFVRRSEWLPQYEQAAAAVAATDPERVGLVQGNDSWEYAWWILLPDDTEIFALQSVVPGEAPADPASSTRSSAPRTSRSARCSPRKAGSSTTSAWSRTPLPPGGP